jgi:hypothetical protein
MEALEGVFSRMMIFEAVRGHGGIVSEYSDPPRDCFSNSTRLLGLEAQSRPRPGACSRRSTRRPARRSGQRFRRTRPRPRSSLSGGGGGMRLQRVGRRGSAPRSSPRSPPGTAAGPDRAPDRLRSASLDHDRTRRCARRGHRVEEAPGVP